MEIDGISSDSAPQSGTVYWTNLGTGAGGTPDKYGMQASLESAFVIASEQVTANVATITTAIPHGLATRTIR